MTVVSLRMKTSIVMGALLGVVCIIGAGARTGLWGNFMYLLALWYNRLLMGVVIGLATSRKRRVALLRGAFLGLMVSLAFYLTTELGDHVTFLAGILYGVIIDYVASRHSQFVNSIISRLRGKEAS